jgi:hypothetical protein
MEFAGEDFRAFAPSAHTEPDACGGVVVEETTADGQPEPAISTGDQNGSHGATVVHRKIPVKVSQWL